MKFFVSFIVGFIVYFCLGGLFYGFVFKSMLPVMPEENNSDMMMYITIGCAWMALLLAYIFTRIGGIANRNQAMIHGSIICVIVSLAMHTFYFDYMSNLGWNMNHRWVDLIINILMGAITSAVMYFVLNKFLSKAE